MSLTLTDMFCGAGGSSTGALDVPGVRVKSAMNHWQLAIDTHNSNHQETEHLCADVSQVNPRYVASSDILWASPECTNHSVAKGKKRGTNQPDLFGDVLPDEAADRSRATMWDVPRFAEHHGYKIIITENVVDAAKWVMFDAWMMAMTALGYEHHIVYLNSMHAQYGGLPAPQSRDRMYVVFWLKGNRRPDFERYFRPKAYCDICDQTVNAMQVFKKAERWGRYRAQYNYRCPNTACRNQIVEPGWLPASSAIDWTITGERIGDRNRPLAAKTIARIEAGLRKFGAQSDPFLSLMRSGRARNYQTSETLQTLTTEGAGHCLVDPHRTPLIVNHLSGSDETRTLTVNSPLRTLVAGGLHESLLIPVEGREGKSAASVHAALRTMTTRNETGLLMSYYGNGGMKSVGHPIDTLSTRDRFAMITTLRGTNAPKDVADPLDTFAANGTHHALTEWKVPEVDDCLFRMLEPHEIKRGMAFPTEYLMLGNKREQVKMSGNAVTPPAARDLIACAAESLESS